MTQTSYRKKIEEWLTSFKGTVMRQIGPWVIYIYMEIDLGLKIPK